MAQIKHLSRDLIAEGRRHDWAIVMGAVTFRPLALVTLLAITACGAASTEKQSSPPGPTVGSTAVDITGTSQLPTTTLGDTLGGDDFAVGPTTAGWGWRCADLVTAETKERVCVDTPRQAYAWPVGDRVFLVGGDALQLLDGRTIEPEQEGRFAVIEILPGEHPYESFESPDFCRRWEIVQAIRAYTPERFGWGNDSCILDEYAASTMIDTTGRQFYGFARKIDGEWTFLQMVPAAEFLGCDQLDPPAREVCSAG